MAKIVSINISAKKGTKKHPVPRGKLIEGLGLEGDAHASPGAKQVSLLSIDDIKNLGPGDFAENITIDGIDLADMPIGTIIKIGKDAILKISRIGKECHTRCEVYRRAGDCVMPSKGVFAEVVKSGEVCAGDVIIVI